MSGWCACHSELFHQERVLELGSGSDRKDSRKGLCMDIWKCGKSWHKQIHVSSLALWHIIYHDPFGDSDMDSGGMVQSLLVYRIVYMRFLGLRLPKNHVRTVSHRLPQQTLQALVCHLSES